LRAAGPIFAEKGFEQATVREICERAGVNPAGVNYYFGSKQDLYKKVVMYARRLREEQARLPNWPPGTPADQRLRSFVATMVEQVLGEGGEPWQFQLIIREILEPTEACEEMVRETFRPYFDVLVGILAELFPRQVARDHLEQLALSVVGQCVYYRVHQHVIPMLVSSLTHPDRYTPQRVARHITETTLAATGAGPSLAAIWAHCRPDAEDDSTDVAQ
jgi:AcrR family transcriptional regulator